MLLEPALRFVNHLLTDEDWARSRLKVFSGQLVRFEIGSFGVPLEISPAGFFRSTRSAALQPASVTVSLPTDAPLRLLTDRTSLPAAARISGSADLAECLGFVLRNLHWDAESDLAQVVGDVAARRLLMGGKQLVQWQRDQARNLALNFAEYFTEESSMIARREDVSTFCRDVKQVEDTTSRLERRITQLERSER